MTPEEIRELLLPLTTEQLIMLKAFMIKLKNAPTPKEERREKG